MDENGEEQVVIFRDEKLLGIINEVIMKQIYFFFQRA